MMAGESGDTPPPGPSPGTPRVYVIYSKKDSKLSQIKEILEKVRGCEVDIKEYSPSTKPEVSEEVKQNIKTSRLVIYFPPSESERSDVTSGWNAFQRALAKLTDTDASTPAVCVEEHELENPEETLKQIMAYLASGKGSTELYLDNYEYNFLRVHLLLIECVQPALMMLLHARLKLLDEKEQDEIRDQVLRCKARLKIKPGQIKHFEDALVLAEKNVLGEADEVDKVKVTILKEEIKKSKEEEESDKSELSTHETEFESITRLATMESRLTRRIKKKPSIGFKYYFQDNSGNRVPGKEFKKKEREVFDLKFEATLLGNLLASEDLFGEEYLEKKVPGKEKGEQDKKESGEDHSAEGGTTKSKRKLLGNNPDNCAVLDLVTRRDRLAHISNISANFNDMCYLEMKNAIVDAVTGLKKRHGEQDADAAQKIDAAVEEVKHVGQSKMREMRKRQQEEIEATLALERRENEELFEENQKLVLKNEGLAYENSYLHQQIEELRSQLPNANTWGRGRHRVHLTMHDQLDNGVEQVDNAGVAPVIYELGEAEVLLQTVTVATAKSGSIGKG